jgi:phosphate transport system substrate-binding protein
MRRDTIGVLAALLATAIAGCGGGGNSGGGSAAGGAGAGGAGAPVIVDGSSTVYRISLAAQETYAEVNPAAKIVVDYHGTGGGFGRYLRGEVDIVDASRKAKPEEESKAKQQGYDWTRFIVGYDGITVVVNPKNDFVKALTVAQLKSLWGPGSKVKTWKDLDPSWPDRAIKLYSPDDDSGTFEFFTEATVGKAKSQRKDAQQSSDDNVLVTGVAGDLDGLGYFGYAYYASNAAKLRAVPVQAGPDAPPVLPDPETILSGKYKPLSRPLFIYVKDSAMKRPEVAAFVKYYLENVAKLAKEGGYTPPTDEDLAANRKALEGPTSGTATAAK